MNLKKFGLRAMTFALLTGAACLNCFTPEQRANPVLERRVATTRESKEEPFVVAIREILIKDFLEEYLNGIKKVSPHFQKLDRTYGKDRLLDEYVAMHELCFQAAILAQTQDFTEKDYNDLGRKIAEKEANLSAGISPVNNFDNKLLQDYANGAKLESEHYLRLLKTAKKLDSFVPVDKSDELKKSKKEYVKNLVQAAYSKKEFQEYIEKYAQSSDKFWADSYATIDNLIVILFAKDELERIAKFTRKSYEAEIQVYFPEQPATKRK